MKNIHNIINSIKKNISNSSFKGYNPYDILASPFLNKIHNHKILIILTQLNKLSPFNFRPVLKIKQLHNPKAIALILLSYSLQKKLLDKDELTNLINILVEGKSNKFDDYSIGFPFPIVLSHYKSNINEPSLIISLFVIYSMINLRTINKTYSKIINSFEHLIHEKLPQKEDDKYLSYSYNFNKFNEVYNATAKIGKFYALKYEYDPKDVYKTRIFKILNYLHLKQREDGSWPYAEKMNYSDGYHTAFILEALYYMLKVVNNQKFEGMLHKAKNNYFKSFFLKNYQPIYYHPKYKPSFPKRIFTQTDIRDCAMALIISKIFDRKEYVEGVFNWTINNMYNNKKGFFNFYKEYFWSNKINYIRAQAWMLYSLSFIKETSY